MKGYIVHYQTKQKPHQQLANMYYETLDRLGYTKMSRNLAKKHKKNNLAKIYPILNIN